MKEMNRKNLVIFLLRIGLAFVFLYAGISILTNPTSWIGFIPKFMEVFVSGYTILYAHAFFDIVLGIWLLYWKKIFYASVLCSLNLLGIILFNLGSLDIIFRDLGLLFSSLALAVLSYEEEVLKNKTEVKNKKP